MKKSGIVRDVSGDWSGEATLVKSKDGRHYVVSSVAGVYATETMIFLTDKNAEVLDWGDVWCRRGHGHHKEGIKAAIDGKDLCDEW